MIPHTLLRWLKKVHQLKSLRLWRKNKYPVPPPHIVKAAFLKKLAEKKELNIFVETGTYMGDMIDELKYNFEFIYSIELYKPLYSRAKKIFSKYQYIKILSGNSSLKIKAILRDIKQPALFWLDAHYSGDGTARASKNTPIIKELEAIAQSSLPHVVVIDDARLFNGQSDYPTIRYIKKQYGNSYTIITIHDMIVLLPK